MTTNISIGLITTLSLLSTQSVLAETPYESIRHAPVVSESRVARLAVDPDGTPSIIGEDSQISSPVSTRSGEGTSEQAASCNASSRTSSPSRPATGGTTDTISGFSDWLSGILNPVSIFMAQVGCYRESVVERLGENLGGLRETYAQIRGTIEEVIGSLNLLDPDQFLEDVLGRGNSHQSSGDKLPVSQVNPVLGDETLRVVGNINNSRSDSQSVLSEAAQESMQTQLESLGEQVEGGVQQATTTNDLAEQSMNLFAGNSCGSNEDSSDTDDAGGDGGSAVASADVPDAVSDGELGSGEIPGCSQAAARESVERAQQAQSRISTQDAIKDLNSINANISVQMSQLSNQSGIQSQQLGQLSNQNAIALQLNAAQLGRLNQTVTGVAVANQTLADINERDQGDRQATLIQQAAEMNRVNRLNSTGYRLTP